MGFFDFLGVLVVAIVLLILPFVLFDIWKRYQEQNDRRKYFESQKPKILEAIDMLEEARKQIPLFASEQVRLNGGYVDLEMRRQFELMVAGCRMRFGDYVTKMALLNMGMEEYVYHSTDPVLKGLLGTRF